MSKKYWSDSLKALALLAALGIAAQSGATGMMSCDSGPQEDWQSQASLQAKLESEGWQVRKTKIDEGCYEVYGTTPEGQRVEAYFDPVTFEKLLVARRGEILFRKDSE